MARTQPATFNEVWSDDRVFSYLNHGPTRGDHADFAVMYQAYKHMRAIDFKRLLTKFVADGRDINATNKNGQRIHDIIAEHQSFSNEFLEVLNEFN